MEGVLGPSCWQAKLGFSLWEGLKRSVKGVTVKRVRPLRNIFARFALPADWGVSVAGVVHYPENAGFPGNRWGWRGFRHSDFGLRHSPPHFFLTGGGGRKR